ncbi:MAG: hypothetical protein IK001_04260 [Lachnospiraceae bacterium]|nr:hypothetical protein [Lachnospiraceae bacterium]
MLYKNTDHLDDRVFKDPGPEYRGTPFWAWNTTMTKENIRFLTEVFKDMGMGGAHCHVRTGLTNRYLSDEFMELIEEAHRDFAEKGMLTWLYDEDRWPSGAAGGIVTKDHRYRSRFLVLSDIAPDAEQEGSDEFISSAEPVKSKERTLLGRYAVALRDGYLASYRMLGDGEEPRTGERIKYAYLEVSGDSPWFNNEAYVNTLDKRSIDEFIKVTHERYYSRLGEYFGKDIPAIFTDEPQFPAKQRLGFAEDARPVAIPFSDDFEEDFTKRYGHSLLNSLPELFWELPDGRYSVVRYEYHDFVSERFAEAFADNVGDWCKKHNIMLTGHMMSEPTLESQTAALGEAMRSYMGFDIPGIDMLCDYREFSTAKQAASAAHQLGAPGIMSELYGVTGYYFDLRGHKLQGDWQAALGVTVRVPHLTWTAMAGEAKRDYPASIGYQSPWYKEYRYIEDYFGRLNTALTRGKPDIRVAVIHPIESYWLLWGNDAQTGDIRKQRDEEFLNLINWLLFGFIDFDLLSESLLAGFDHGVKNGKFRCGVMEYDAVVVPDLITIRSSTLKLLEEFAEAGGKVIFAGRVPELLDARPSDEPAKAAEKCVRTAFDRYDILQALEDMRIIDIRTENGMRAGNLLYQMREEKDCKWLFVSHAFKTEPVDLPRPEKLLFTIKGAFRPVLYDALTGETGELPYEIKAGKTLIKREMYQHDSMLLKLEPVNEESSAEHANAICGCREASDASDEETVFRTSAALDIPVPAKVEYSLQEPNVLLLDMAEYSLDGEPFRPIEEVLRLDNILRRELGWPLRGEAWAQPWAVMDRYREYEHELRLRYVFESEIEAADVTLALEDADDCAILFNGNRITEKAEGYYVDLDIKNVRIGKLQKGRNELIVTMPYNAARNVEAVYLLGDFGVRIAGSTAKITEKPAQLAFDDISKQDLGFYSGNIDYLFDIDVPRDGDLVISATMFRCPAVAAEIDGVRAGLIAFAPYEVKIKDVKKGRHSIKLTAFGNRMNTFGPLHLCDVHRRSQSPNSWRSEGARWSYEYKTDSNGILKRPEIVLIRNL